MKILTVVGARPQFVKAATVTRQLRKAGAHEILLHTGQHFDENMSKVFFDEMEIPRPDYNLEVSNLSHGAMTGRMLEKIEEVLLKERPDWVLVYGDTNSTLAGALAAVKLHIPVAHVEAGLRSFEMKMPEEVNRILTDRISKLLFCPTATAVSNLTSEGYQAFDCTIVPCGDVMYDAVLYYRDKARSVSTIIPKSGLSTPFALVTLHRAENTDDTDRLTGICEALNDIAATIPVVWPLHPRTRSRLSPAQLSPGIRVMDPVGYFDMLALLEACSIVLTDSGGLQKEAYFFGKYCITLRDQTEWIELVNAGVNVLAGADKASIVRRFKELSNKTFPARTGDLYGDGNAAATIVDRLLKSQV